MSKKVDPKLFTEILSSNKIEFFCGVPDSILKEFCHCISYEKTDENHVVSANEGSAIGLAIGYHLGTNKIPLVYMQNSGIGNAINPLISLANKNVYSIPMILLIGWRGEIIKNNIQIEDEPQHQTQGKITEKLLKLLSIPYQIISNYNDINKLKPIIKLASTENKPVALLIRKNTFSNYQGVTISSLNKNNISREKAIELIVGNLPNDIPIISTTGMASRELYEIKKTRKNNNNLDFLTVGGMGHASQIAVGLGKKLKNKKIVCLDGDGAFIMHMGGVLYSASQTNIIHIVLNNGSHDSVGGHNTFLPKLKLKNIAESVNFHEIFVVNKTSDIKKSLKKALKSKSSCFIEIFCSPGYRSDLGRPKTKPVENKKIFMKEILKLM